MCRFRSQAVRWLAPALLLLAFTTAVSGEPRRLNQAQQGGTLDGVEDLVKRLSGYGRLVSHTDLSPDFESFGRALAVMAQNMYATKMAGTALLDGLKQKDPKKGSYDTVMLDSNGKGAKWIKPAQINYTPVPTCKELGCACENGLPSCYLWYELLWSFGCPCAQNPGSTDTGSTCRYDIVNGDVVEWNDPIFGPIRRAPRCPISQRTVGKALYDCKGTGCRVKYRENTDRCDHPCPGKKILCTDETPFEWEPKGPFKHKVIGEDPDQTLQGQQYLEQCDPDRGDANCYKNIACGAPEKCGSDGDDSKCEKDNCVGDPKCHITAVDTTKCQYTPDWTGMFMNSPDPAVLCKETNNKLMWEDARETCPDDVLEQRKEQNDVFWQ